jgi:hypothetical protein
VASQPDTGYVDAGPGGGYYKITAVDLHGNESGYALVTPAETIVVGGGPLGLELAGARTNPVSGRAVRVGFVLPGAEAAQLELFEVTGRRVAAREVGALGAGAHEVDLAERGRIRPGLYFVRLRQGARQKLARVTVLE